MATHRHHSKRWPILTQLCSSHQSNPSTTLALQSLSSVDRHEAWLGQDGCPEKMEMTADSS